MKYRYRVREVEAMSFDGTPEGARAVIMWAYTVASDVVIRQRVEYTGWHDHAGHVELEIQGVDEQCGIGDWVVIDSVPGGDQVRVVDGRAFRRLFEVDSDRSI